jgi:hypothetical protein
MSASPLPSWIAPVAKVKVQPKMHRDSIAVFGATVIAYCLVHVIPTADLPNAMLRSQEVKDARIKRLRQVAPEIRPIDLKEPEAGRLVGQLGTLESGLLPKNWSSRCESPG